MTVYACSFGALIYVSWSGSWRGIVGYWMLGFWAFGRWWIVSVITTREGTFRSGFAWSSHIRRIEKFGACIRKKRENFRMNIGRAERTAEGISGEDREFSRYVRRV
jgi:hypothetical protein